MYSTAVNDTWGVCWTNGDEEEGNTVIIQDRGDEQTFQLGTRDEGIMGPNVQ